MKCIRPMATKKTEVIELELVGLEALPEVVRGRWLLPESVQMRNAAWWVRNARWAGQDEAKMIAWLVLEVRRRLVAGEPLESVVPSLVDLFLKP